MSDPTGIISDTGEWTDQMGYWHPKGCRCEGCIEDAYVPDPHPNRWDKTTNTIWAWSDDAQEYIDTKREPSVMERWTYELTPITTPFATTFPSKISMGDPVTKKLKMEWGINRE